MDEHPYDCSEMPKPPPPEVQRLRALLLVARGRLLLLDPLQDTSDIDAELMGKALSGQFPAVRA